MKALFQKLVQLKAGLCSRCRNVSYKLLGCRIDGYVWMRSIRIPRQWEDIHIGEGTALDEGVVLLASGDPAPGKITIGARVYINRNSFLDASRSIVIGEDAMIGPNCYITDHDHVVQPGQSPGSGGLTSAATRIGKRCWIGAGVTILKGVSIGDDSVIGAGSIVTKTIPEGVLAVGSPARVLRDLTEVTDHNPADNS